VATPAYKYKYKHERLGAGGLFDGLGLLLPLPVLLAQHVLVHVGQHRDI